MGVYIVTIGEHDIHPNSESKLPSLAMTLNVISHHEDVWRYWWTPPVRWPIELRKDTVCEWYSDGTTDYDGISFIKMVGAYGLRIDIGPRFFAILPTPKWGAFINDPKIQAAVTKLCTAIGQCLGAKQLLYIPDSAYCPSSALDFLYQDMSLEAIVDWLSNECGPSALTISSIKTELTDQAMRELIPNWDRVTDSKVYEYDGYYVSNVS